MLQIYTNEANFYMYGVRKHVEVSSSNTYIVQWQNSTGVHYYTTPDKNYAQCLMKMLVDKLDRGMVSGHTLTEIQILKIDDYINELKNVNDPQKFSDLHIDLVAYFVEIGLKLEGKEFKFDDPNDHKKYKDTMYEVEKWRNINFANSSMNSSGVPDTTDGINGQNAAIYAHSGVKDKTNEDTEIDPRDGVPFTEYNINGYKSLCVLDNKENEGCIRIGDFAYSNYTLPRSVSHYDIDYSKFWNENYANDGSKLFEYKMGDIGKHTKFTYTEYGDATTTKGKELLLDKNNDGTFKTFGNGLISMDYRIVAYFPIPVYSNNKEDISLMHKFNNYYDESINEGKYHGFNGNGGMKEDTNTDLNLVDVVFEKYDNNGAKHQFVVPFIVGGTKWLHQSKQKKMYSMFTDNRYGQITEDITNPDLNSRVLKGYANYYYKDGNTNVAKEKKLQNSELGTMTYMGFVEETPSEEIIKTAENTYPSYNDTRTPINCSPIEPVKYGGGSDVTTDLINQVFPGVDTRIVSMRVYNIDIEEQIGVNDSDNWKRNINRDLPTDYSSHNGDFNYIFENFYNWYDGEYHGLNQVVKYPSINNSE